MSLESKIGKSVLDLGDLVKSEVVLEVAKAKNDGRMTVADDDFQFLVKLLQSTVDATVRKGVDGVLRNLK